MVSAQPVTSSTLLRGRWLLMGRATWLVVTALTVMLFVIAVPVRFQELQQVCLGAICKAPQLTPDDVRALQDLGLSIRFHATYNIALEILFAAVHVAIGTVIFWRRSEDRMALFVALMLTTFGTTAVTGTMNALTQRYSAWRIPLAVISPLPDVVPGWPSTSLSAWGLPIALVSYIGQLSAALFFYIFPDGRFVPRWTGVLAVGWIAWQVLTALLPASFLNYENWPPLLEGAAWSSFVVTYVFAQVYRYRRVSDQVQRQQTKWVVLGVTGALGGFLGAVLLAGILASLGQPGLVYRGIVVGVIYVSMLLIPVSIGVAILRSRLWDVGVIVNRTLVYGGLTATLGLVYLVCVIVLQGLFRTVTGQRQSSIVIAISTLAISILFSPVMRRIQSAIDRRFYRRKYDAARTLAAFSATLRDEVHLDRLSDDLLSVVQETMQPAHVSLWLAKAPLGRRKPDRGM